MNQWFISLFACWLLVTPELASAKTRKQDKRKRSAAGKEKSSPSKDKSQLKCVGAGVERRCYYDDGLVELIGDWSDAQRAADAGEQLSAEQEDEESLADAIGRAFSWPTPSPIELLGAEEALSLSTTFDYTRKRAKRMVKDVVKPRLRGLRGRSVGVCFAGPPKANGDNDIVYQMSLAKGADKTLLGLLGVPEDQIEPYNLLRLKVDGQVYRLREDEVGSDLFEALGAKLKVGKTVYLSMNPAPRRVPPKVTIPAKVNGASQEFVLAKKPGASTGSFGSADSIEIKPDAKWVIRPGNKTVPVNRSLLAHRLLIRKMMGKSKKEERKSITIKPRDWLSRTPVYRRDLGDVVDYELHAHGREALWFGKSSFTVSAEMYVRSGESDCDLLVEVFPIFPRITIGAWSRGEWRQATGLTVIDPATHKVRIGYMDSPFCGGIIE